MNKPLFSVVLIARNEEKTLPRMVASLKEFQERGGEILLLDTGSKDKTAEVARSLGCIVREVGDIFRITISKELADKINKHFVVDDEQPLVKEGESLFDYASARNYIAEYASNNHIATPDCDEIYTKFDIDKINEAITNGAGQLEYEFVFSHDEYGNPVIKFRHCKFYDRTKLKWSGVIHEVLVGEAKKVYLDESIIKLEHYQNTETNRSGYLKGLALDCFNHPESDRNSHYLAREMMYLGRFKSAIKEFKRHITLGGWPTEASQSMLYIGDCYKYLGDHDEMAKWYLKSFDKEARREPLMRLAEYYFYRNNHQQTIAYAEAALTVTQLPFYSNHQPYYEDTPHALLYVSYWWIGRKDKSEEHWKKAIAFSPKNKKYIEDGKFYNQKFTGERYIPGIPRPDMEAEHYARYNFAAGYTKDKIVLDAACGTGFGKDILKAKEYYGVDIAPELDCIHEDLERGVSLKIKPDVVVSFETIEHLENPHNFLQWIKDNSKVFVFSIPINMPSEFHKQVYSEQQIKDLITKYFPNTSFYGQVLGDIKKDITNPKYIVGVSIIDTPKISFIIPHLGREEGLKRCIESIEKLNYPESKIEGIVKEDSFENRIGVPKLLKKGIEESTGDWIVYAANDCEFTPDSITEALAVGDKGFVAFNTGVIYPDEGNICEHFMIRKDIIAKIGEVFDTDFYHIGVDNLLWAKMKKLGIAVRADKAIVKHKHFAQTGEPMDEVYKIAWDPEKVEHDRTLLKKKLEELA